jgi:hypothetical protein
VLIGAGVIFLLANLGYLQTENVWAVLWRFWPALLILVGIDVLFGRRSTLGAVISALLGVAVVAAIIALVWFAPRIPALSGLQTSPELRSERVTQSADGISEAEIVIDVGGATFRLDELEESASLIEADVSHYGVLKFDVNKRGDRAEVEMDVSRPNPVLWFSDKRETWDVGLSRDVDLVIDLDAGSGRYDVDLSGLQVSELRFDQGSGETSLVLPSRGEVDCSIDLGSGELDITLPEGVEARVDLDKGSGDFRPGPQFHLVRGREEGSGVWETDNYGSADDRVSIEMDMGSGDVSIR